MVDIHSHILPGLDDGARTIEESLDMLRLAAASGTTDIVATPHANAQFAFDEQKVEQALRELSEKMADVINLHWGCDFHLSYENLHDALGNPEKYTINHRIYLMVELPDLVSLSTMRGAMRQLLNAQIVPVITHPERNPSLQPRLRELSAWRDDGCLFQVTGQSFLGRFGPHAQHAAAALMKAGMVHFVASDAHDCVGRSPDLSDAYRYISSHYGEESADLVLIQNPTAAIWGEPVLPGKPKSQKLARLFTFWK